MESFSESKSEHEHQSSHQSTSHFESSRHESSLRHETKSFLNSESKVSGVQDILERMRNADNGTSLVCKQNNRIINF